MQKLARGNNARYWVAKIQRNIERDKIVSQALTQMGWLPLRVWEGDIRKEPNRVAKRIMRTVVSRKSA